MAGKCLQLEIYTFPNINIAPENRPLEKEIPIGNHHFQVRTVSFREYIKLNHQSWSGHSSHVGSFAKEHRWYWTQPADSRCTPWGPEKNHPTPQGPGGCGDFSERLLDPNFYVEISEVVEMLLFPQGGKEKETHKTDGKKKRHCLFLKFWMLKLNAGCEK